jgi:putative ABC transport system permease protein
MIAIGVVLGLGLTLACTRLIAARLYGLGALDPLTIAVAVAALGLVALVASYIPALRATSVNPTTALRHE